LHQALHRQQQDRTRLSSGKEVSLALVDGTAMGGHRFSVLSFAGAVFPPADAEPSRGRGHELADSRRLLRRAVQVLGSGFATHMVYDGLMAVKKDFVRVRHLWGMHLVVKTKEETLEVVQSCRAAWWGQRVAALQAVGAAVARGVDAARGVSYRVCAQSGIEWGGLAELLNVAWVQETPLKGPRAGQTEEFWVLTTDATLTAAELREVAHARWGIENLGFKATNAQVGSKLGYVRNARVKETLRLLWSWGLGLLGAWRQELRQQPAWRQWRVRKTKWLVGLVLTVTALGGELFGCGSSPGGKLPHPWSVRSPPWFPRLWGKGELCTTTHSLYPQSALRGNCSKTAFCVLFRLCSGGSALRIIGCGAGSRAGRGSARTAQGRPGLLRDA